MSYPNDPGYKVGGASQRVAEEHVDFFTELRDQVELFLHERGPATAEQIAAALRVKVDNVRPRLSELQLHGRANKSGRPAVWSWGKVPEVRQEEFAL